MQQLQTFMYDEQAVRTLFDSKGEVFFVGNDVAKLLGYSNYRNAVINHVDTEDKQRTQIEDAGQSREMTIINESGLYSLILSSKLPTAKQFKRWVTSEVLPNIRKHGTHMTSETIEKVLADPDTIIQIATQLKEERAKRMQAEVIIEQQKPKVLFAQAVETSETSILVGQLAKLLTQNGVNIGQNRLFSWLRENGYLGKKGAHYNEPTQYAVERTMQNSDGSVRITRTTKVTGKGQVYFINKLLTQAG